MFFANSENRIFYMPEPAEVSVRQYMGRSVIRPAFPDCSENFTKAVRQMFPDAKFQADHFHTVKNIREHLEKGLSEYGKNPKAAGEKEQDEQMPETASELRKLGRSLLKKPPDPGGDEKKEQKRLKNICLPMSQIFLMRLKAKYIFCTKITSQNCLLFITAKDMLMKIRKLRLSDHLFSEQRIQILLIPMYYQFINQPCEF